MAGVAQVGRVGRRIMQRIWDPEPVNNRNANEPVWCLGCSYTMNTKRHDTAKTTPPDEAVEPAEEEGRAPSTASSTSHTPHESAVSSVGDSPPEDDIHVNDGGWPQEFLDDFESRIWMTYRTGFEVIPMSTDARVASALSLTMRLRTSFGEQTGFSSDTGWGCMIRSGQSLLANAILITRLGRDWRRSSNAAAERDIISYFADDPSAPYSIHNFVKHGAAACGKYPGEWFGPSATARCIEALTNEHDDALRVYSRDLPEVYEDSFTAVANPDGQGFRPTLILVGTRLGIDRINRIYEEALISTIQMPQSIGIAGGRPSSSLYFVGAHGRRLFYLDPHHPRPALPFHRKPEEYTTEELDSCHTRRLRQLRVEDLDPSMLIGFLIRNEDDWEQWKMSVKHVQGKAIITVSPFDPAGGTSAGRAGAIDEVETLSDDEDADVIVGSSQND